MTPGKLHFIALHALSHAGSRNWVVGLTHNQCVNLMDDTMKLLQPWDDNVTLRRSDNKLLLSNGSVIEFKSSRSLDSMRGFAVDAYVVDEMVGAEAVYNTRMSAAHGAGVTYEDS
jgi:hypothetical protein